MPNPRAVSCVVRDLALAASAIGLCAILAAHIATRPRYAILAVPQLKQTDMVNAMATDNTVAVILDTRTGDVAPVCITPSTNPLWTAWWTGPAPSMIPPPKAGN